MQQRVRSHWVRNYDDGRNVHDFCSERPAAIQDDYGGKNRRGLDMAFGNYIYDTSECFHLMGFGNRYSPSSRCT
jgi:hypothetical protein